MSTKIRKQAGRLVVEVYNDCLVHGVGGCGTVAMKDHPAVKRAADALRAAYRAGAEAQQAADKAIAVNHQGTQLDEEREAAIEVRPLYTVAARMAETIADAIAAADPVKPENPCGNGTSPVGSVRGDEDKGHT